MKRVMTQFFKAGFLASSISLAAMLGAAERGPLEIAAENAALAEKFSRSIVTVRYYVKRDAEGNEPSFAVPYKCPNCNNTHWREDDVSSDDGIPAEFAGFLLSPDRVLLKDLRLDPACVDRIEVVCGDETRTAFESEAVPDQKGLILKLDKAFDAGRPLVFTGGGAPKAPRYFYLVQEKGLLVAGVAASKSTAFKYVVAKGQAYYEGTPNTLVLDEKGDPVTVALADKVVLGQEVFSAPATWKTEPAAARLARRENLIARVRKGVLPVCLQFEAKTKERESFIHIGGLGSDAEVGTDLDAVGILLGDGTVVILANLSSADTARLSKIEATLPDGRKVPLTFKGSYRQLAALAAVFDEGRPAGVEPFTVDCRSALELFGETFDVCTVEARGGEVKVRDGQALAAETKRVKGNEAVIDWQVESGSWHAREIGRDGVLALVLGADGALLACEAKARTKDSWADSDAFQGGQLQALVDKPDFDPENVPRANEDRRRTPWLGVEAQLAGADVLREKKAAGYFKTSFYREMAAMVSEVAPDSPAAQLGIKAGDVLLTIKHAGGKGREKELCLQSEHSVNLNWDEVFADQRFLDAVVRNGVTPWPNVEGGINAALEEFGVGAEVEVAWVSDGVRKTGKTTLALAAVHYQNAPRVRHKDLAMTVCDMTAEVRKFFKFDENAPGVVVAKIKSGGPAAVAGLRQMELITEVDGEGVKSAKDFQERLKGKKDVTLTVRRLSTTRIVPLKLP